MKSPKLPVALFAVALLAVSLQAQAAGFRCLKPFQANGTVSFPLRGGAQGTASFPVPAGYRLQIEHVSAEVSVPTSTGRASFAILTTAGGTAAWQTLPILEGSSLLDRQTSGVVSLYADAGSSVRIEIARTSSLWGIGGRGLYNVSGCLIGTTDA